MPEHPSLLKKDLISTADRTTRTFFILEVYFVSVSVSDTRQKGFWGKKHINVTFRVL